MTDARTVGQELQGQILNTIRQSQEAVVDAIRTWADSVRSVTPSLPMPAMPLADRLPRPADLVASAYDFAEQLLAAQRKFAEDVIQATAPVLAAATDGDRKAGSDAKKAGGPAA